MSKKIKRTYVCLILDESESMAQCKDAIISGYNEQLNMIKAGEKDGGETKVSLMTFGAAPDARPHIAYWNGSTDKLLRLTEENYKPFGNTPMYDAVGMALTQLEQENQEGNVGFLVIVISDGQENASKDWNSAKVATLINRLQASGKYTFAYIGANQDLSKTKATTGINQTFDWANTKIGTQSMYATLNNSTADYFAETRRYDSTTTAHFFPKTT